ncbi:hypothetical protein ACFOUR_13065 [Halovivax cerinus]|uniref:Uncharacterized protein n=1 Tax=Halovivax cerinus TaxID=1487865 RepID=A0ABD5NRB2_9EURY
MPRWSEPWCTGIGQDDGRTDHPVTRIGQDVARADRGVTRIG